MQSAVEAFLQGSDDVDVIASMVIGKDSWMELIKHLGDGLTSTDEHKRERATSCLTAVLEATRGSTLNTDVSEHLLTFLCERLTDYPALSAVLRALLALAQTSLSSEQALKLTLALAERCDVRSLVQAQRRDALQLALLLVTTHWPALQPSGCRVLMSLLRALDGEKDPRNLLSFLQLLRELCARCASSAVAGLHETLSEVFEALSCYFPILFTPPRNDPHQITTTHLLSALLSTLCSTTVFAPLAIPFFIDKLSNPESDEPGAQLQALQALAVLGPAYGGESIAIHSDRLSHGLVSLIRSSASSLSAAKPRRSADAIQVAIIHTLRTLLRCYEHLDLPAVHAMLTPLLSLLSDETPSACDLELAARLVRVMTRSSVRLAEVVVHEALPRLTRVLGGAAGPPREAHAEARLTLLLEMLRAARDETDETDELPAELRLEVDGGMATTVASMVGAPLAHPGVVSELALHVSSTLAFMLSCHELSSSHLSRAVLAQAVCVLLSSLLKPSDTSAQSSTAAPSREPPPSPLLRNALECVRDVLLDMSVHPPLAEAVASEAGRLMAATDAVAHALWLTEPLEHAVCSSLLQSLSAAHAGADQQAAAALSMRVAILCSVMQSWEKGVALLISLFRAASDQLLHATPLHSTQLDHSLVDGYALALARAASTALIAQVVASDVVPPLLNDLVERAAAVDDETGLACICSIVSSLTPLWQVLSSSPLPTPMLSYASSLLARPLSSTVHPLAPLLLVTLKHSARAIELPPHFQRALYSSCDAMCTAESAGGYSSHHASATNESLMRCLCVTYNKWSTGDDLDAVLADALAKAIASGEPMRLQLWLWLACAATARAGSYIGSSSSTLVNLLASPPDATISPSTWCSTAADGVGLLASVPSADLLIRSSGAQLTPLYSQRLFTSIFPRLLEAHKQAAVGSVPRRALVRASAHVIVHAPAVLVRAHVANALPMLSQLFQVAADEPACVAHLMRLLVAALEVSRDLLSAAAAELSSAPAELLSVWLTLLSALLDDGASANSITEDQIVALERCLDCIAEARLLPYYAIFPYKRRVLQVLKLPLDHRKRRIRQAAAKCVNLWHQLASKR